MTPQHAINKPLHPSVGIFWVDDRRGSARLYSVRVAVSEAEAYGQLRIFPRAHYDEWAGIQTRNPAWVGCEYEDIPRGRVAFDGSRPPGRFLILLGRQFKERRRIRDLIRREFGIPPGRTRWIFDDEHYQRPEVVF